MTNSWIFMNNSWIIHEIFRKKSWKKFWAKKFSFILSREKSREGCSQHACVSLELLEITPKTILRKILQKNLEKKIGKKIWKKFWEKILTKKFGKKNSHSYNHEKNPAGGARNTRVSRTNPSK